MGAEPRWEVLRRVSPAHRAVPRIGGARPLAGLAIAAGLGLAALVIAVGNHATPAPAPAPAPAAPTTYPSVAPVRVVPLLSPTGAPAADLRASEVRLPTIGVRSTLVGLDVGADGALQPPDDPAVAGWFVHGGVPGEPGPTVIAGHVDTFRGPAVFYRLDKLAPGDRVEVTRSDGQVFAYRVVTVALFPKTAFPTDRVYGPTVGSELRLITCGGSFDRSVRSYRDNVVVTAVPAG